MCFLAAMLLGNDRDMRQSSNPQARCAQKHAVAETMLLPRNASFDGAEVEDMAGWVPSSTLLRPLSSEDRLVLIAYLRKHLKVHVHIPTPVGMGATNLSHKAASLVHSIAVECETSNDLRCYLAGCVSWTSDLGTESGLSNVQVPADSLLPSWWQWPAEFEDLSTCASRPCHDLALMFDIDL